MSDEAAASAIGEFSKLAEQLRLRADDNRRRAEELMQRHGVSLDPTSALERRNILLVNTLLPVGTVERLEFELAWADEVARSLEEAFRQMVEQQRQNEEAVSPLDTLTLPPSARPPRAP